MGGVDHQAVADIDTDVMDVGLPEEHQVAGEELR
jgi:hypothetical protein